MKPSIILTAAAGLALLPLSVAAAAQERLCRFERQTLEGVSRTVNLPVIVDSNGRQGEVIVSTTGRRYLARLGQTSAGATSVAFQTDVSRESMTIGPGGETFWQINFHDGMTMAYAGHCGPNRMR